MQFADVVQPQVVLLRQAWPIALAVQSVQAPLVPQAVSTPPDTHSLFWQQKPPPHVPLPPLPQVAVHAPAVQVGLSLTHPVHAPPVAPHSLLEVPATHVLVPAASQQPPLHAVWLAVPQLVVQVCDVVLHAWLAGQSAATLQPQRPATH